MLILNQTPIVIMKRFILFFSTVAIILAVTVSCSNDEVNDALPAMGNADLNGQKMKLTYAIFGRLNTAPLPGLYQPPLYAYIIAGEMDAHSNLTDEPYLFGSIDTLPESGEDIVFDLSEDNISLRCILKNKEYLQNPTNKALSIVSGMLRLQRSANDEFNIEFDIRTEDGNVFSGTSKLNYIP